MLGVNYEHYCRATKDHMGYFGIILVIKINILYIRNLSNFLLKLKTFYINKNL